MADLADHQEGDPAALERGQADALKLEEQAAVLEGRAAVEPLIKAAQIRARTLGEPDRAIGLLRRALQLDAGHRGAINRLAELASEHERWPELVDVLELAARAAAGDDDERAVLLAQRGDVLGRRLGRLAEARSMYREVARLSADRRLREGALDAVEQLDAILSGQTGGYVKKPHFARERTGVGRIPQRPSGTVGAVARPSRPSGIGGEKTAQLWRSASEAVARREFVEARALIEQGLAIEPNSELGVRLRHDLLLAEGRFEDLVRLCLVEAETADTPAAATAAFREAAQIAGDSMGDAVRAIDLYQRALQLEPGDDQILAEAVAFGVRHGSFDIATKLLPDLSSGTRAARLERLAQGAVVLGDHEVAVSYRAAAFDDRPEEVSAFEARIRLLQARHDPAGLDAALRRRLAVISDVTERRAVLWELAMLRESLGQTKEAIEVLLDSILFAQSEADIEDALGSIDRLSKLAFDRALLARGYELAAERASSTAEVKAMRFIQLARLRRDELADFEGSEVALRRANALGSTTSISSELQTFEGAVRWAEMMSRSGLDRVGGLTPPPRPLGVWGAPPKNAPPPLAEEPHTRPDLRASVPDLPLWAESLGRTQSTEAGPSVPPPSSAETELELDLHREARSKDPPTLPGLTPIEGLEPPEPTGPRVDADAPQHPEDGDHQRTYDEASPDSGTGEEARLLASRLIAEVERHDQRVADEWAGETEPRPSDRAPPVAPPEPEPAPAPLRISAPPDTRPESVAPSHELTELDRLAASHLARGDLDSALAVLGTSIGAESAGTAALWTAAGRRALEQSREEDAEHCFVVAAGGTEDSEARQAILSLIGEASARAGRTYDAAIALASEADRDASRRARAERCLEVARRFLAAGAGFLAEGWYESALELCPSDPRPAHALLERYAGRGDRAAIEILSARFDRESISGADAAVWLSALGRVKKSFGEAPAAATDLEQALSMDPRALEPARLLLELGLTHLFDRWIDRALSEIRHRALHQGARARAFAAASVRVARGGASEADWLTYQTLRIEIGTEPKEGAPPIRLADWISACSANRRFEGMAAVLAGEQGSEGGRVGSIHPGLEAPAPLADPLSPDPIVARAVESARKVFGLPALELRRATVGRLVAEPGESPRLGIPDDFDSQRAPEQIRFELGRAVAAAGEARLAKADEVGDLVGQAVLDRAGALLAGDPRVALEAVGPRSSRGRALTEFTLSDEILERWAELGLGVGR